METIKKKIKQLLDVSSIDLLSKEHIGKPNWGQMFDKRMKEQEDLMDELKALAKASKTIIGRVIRLQRCDGYALYLITNVAKNKATVQWLNWCDGYIDEVLDTGCELPVEKAYGFIRQQDVLEEMFSKTK